MKKKAIFTIFLIAAAVYLIISCSSISVKTYNLTSPYIKEHTSITIVMLSDLHNTIHGKDQITLIEKIKNQNPDLILLCGDFISDITKIRGTQALLSGISGLAPIYYVTGNHEHRSGNINKIREELDSYGVIILSDNYVSIEINNNEIIIAGIEDPFKAIYETPGYNQYESMEEAFRELDEIKAYKILIAHRPERIEIYKRYSFDLVLSGHTHGGQVRFPFINGLIAPHQGLFPKYGGGLYEHENLTHIIGRGLSVNPLLPRIGNPPELVVVILEAEKQ